MIKTPEKLCPDCRTLLPLTDYHRQASAADGRQGLCKPCAKARVLAWKRANPARAAEIEQRSRNANAESKRERERAWRLANRDAINARRRERAADQRKLDALI